MTRIDDPHYLRSEQYRDSSNLTRRSDLHARFGTNPQGWFPWLAAQLEFPPAARLLETGCGPGLLWRGLPGCLPDRALLSDFSPGMVREARLALQTARPDLRFAVLDAAALPFPANSFDAAVANHMLYHVPHRDLALANLRRVLRPGGKLFAATNGPRHMAELYAWVSRAAGLTPAEGARLRDSMRLSFNLENGAEQLRASFEQVDCRFYNNELAVTEVEPLIAYARSMMGGMMPGLLSPAVVERLRELWHAELGERGAILIPTEAGLFTAC
jgi:ubiquinone/menaquinone biosynthesis C-methylase UbiE